MTYNFNLKLLICVVSLTWLGAVWATEASNTENEWSNTTYVIEGNKVSFDDKIKSPDFNLLGRASFSYLFWDVYDSYLFTPNTSFDPSIEWFSQTPVMLEIRYKRDIKAKDLIDSTIEQWQHLDYKPRQYEAFVPWLAEQWPDLKEGDRLALLVFDDHSVFFFNKKFLARQDSPQFGKIFLDIWLSESTSEPKLRRKLLYQISKRKVFKRKVFK